MTSRLPGGVRSPSSAAERLASMEGRALRAEQAKRDADAALLAAQDDRRELQAEVDRLRAALRGLYDLLPRWSCKSMEPDGCPVCVAKAALASGEQRSQP